MRRGLADIGWANATRCAPAIDPPSCATRIVYVAAASVTCAHCGLRGFWRPLPFPFRSVRTMKAQEFFSAPVLEDDLGKKRVVGIQADRVLPASSS
jgi:hypothetical protein